MDQQRLFVLARGLRRSPSRRDVLLGLAGAGLGFGVSGLPNGAATKKKHKHKSKHRHKTQRVEPNAFGCIDVGKACASANDCCSGICQGKKGKKRCVAHGEGTCDQEADGFCEAADPNQTTCNDNPACVCITTTAGSKFCTDPSPSAGSGCGPCRTDAVCEALLFPAGSVCAPVAAGNCVSSPRGGFGCFVPCGPKPPEA